MEVIAQRTKRAGSHLYVVAVPIFRLADVIPVPSTDGASKGNRLVDLKHARSFGKYWFANESWVAPPLLLDTPQDLGYWFVREGGIGTRHPRRRRRECRDNRISGCHLVPIHCTIRSRS